MKLLFLVIFAGCILSCKKDCPDKDSSMILFNDQLDTLNQLLVKENVYYMSDVWDQFQNLYDVWPEYDKDNYVSWDLSTHSGYILANELQDSYDPFTRRDFPCNTYADTSGVYLSWVNFVSQPMNFRYVSSDSNSLVIQFSEANVNYYIKYTQL